ncbi:uncharacterized protein LOC135141122 isoform X1 [Zophobas morio]|uniref:uncharacterized protein LOC135141122 isoform X1 n=2 Tax=Zophobas morio TaxID=2755281 RepID=UPI003082EB01
MVQKKAKSKRKTLKAKYKIQRKCREHNRKMRKLKKIGFIAKVSKKDPGIPNLWPFKEVFIKQLKVRRKEEELEKFQKRQHLRALSENLYSLAEDASKKEIDYDIKAKLVSDQISQEHCIDNTRKFFFKELKKVVNDSDVILEVLDARDPLGCRCKQLEDLVLGGEGEKKLVLVLNKVDLIPKDVAQQWLKHLRKTLPAVAFKASTHQRRQFLGQSYVPVEKASTSLLSSSETLGADMLLKLLKNYCRSFDLKKTITVGVAGLPNVGKSSLINSLKRAKTCQVGSIPGVTKTIQRVSLDRNLKLLDSPGVVFSSADQNSLLRNCIPVDALSDPVEPVNSILGHCDRRLLQELYKISAFRTRTNS